MYHPSWHLCNKNVTCIFAILFYDVVVFLKVKPVENFIPTDDKDTKALDELFDSFSGLFNITASGGNDMAVVRLVGSVLSYFKESSQDVIEQVDI